MRANFWKKASHHHLIEHFEPVLGTLLELQIVGNSQQVISAAKDRALSEIDRLEPIFSVFDLESELCRLNMSHGVPVPVSQDLRDVLVLALKYWQLSGGAFHPCADALRTVDSDDERIQIVQELAQKPYEIKGREVLCLTRLPLNLNAVAKGYIIDQGCLAAAQSEDIIDTVVNIGGDLRHVGSNGITIALHDPRSPFDNADVISTVTIQNQGFASSGSLMRPIVEGSNTRSHVFDPRTGKSVEHSAGASVISESAAEADLLATIAMVFDPTEVESHPIFQSCTAALQVTSDSVIIKTKNWPNSSAP